MGKPTVQQIAGLDIVDWLYFNQTLVLVVMEDDELAWFMKLVKLVKTAVAATGTAGIEAEIMKHYVLCFLEILACDDILGPDVEKINSAKVNQHNKDFFCAFLIAIDSKSERNYPVGEALSIAHALVDDVSSAPAAVRFRLAHRCLAAEYIYPAHDAFMWFVKAEAIPCAKFRDADVRPRISHEAAVARIGLLCEFECLRFHIDKIEMGKSSLNYRFHKIASNLSMSDKQLVLEAGELWMDHHFPGVNSTPIFYVDRQSDKKYVVDFLKQVHLNWSRQRFCVGTSASWPSNLGALFIMIWKSGGDSRPIYHEENENGVDTLAESAKNSMLSYGVTIYARSLYVRYREFTTTMRMRIEAYYRTIQSLSVVLPAEKKDIFYSQMCDFPWDAKSAEEAQLKWGSLQKTEKIVR